MDTRLPIRGLGLCSGRAKRPFFREILGVKVRVNLLAEVLREAGEKEENGNARLRYNAAQQLFNGNEEWNSQSRQGDHVEQLSARVFPFSRPQPRKTSGLREAPSAGHLNGVRNAFQQVPRTWNRGRRTPVCVLVV
jgi:hypothetical protein